MAGDTTLPPAVALLGPTAIGKTELARRLARRFPVEVISVDSALVYRDMDIGTAKPDAELLAELPHFLVDIRDPDQAYSVAEFRADALQLMQEITARGNLALLVGGTMLYFRVLLDGLAELPATDPDIRRQLGEEAGRLGWPAMHQRLAAIDPATAAELHPNHSQRIQRALEIYYSCGETLSALKARQPAASLPFRLRQFALLPADRQQLHARIAERFHIMLEQGFLQEMQALRNKYTLNADMMSMRAVGYRQAWEHLEGEYDYPELLRRGVAATRQLAKRQLTWLRKWPDIERIELSFDRVDPLEDAEREISRVIAAL